MRHASTEPGRAGGDHGRVLDEQGRHDAPLVGARLAALGWIPQVMVSSDATRTRQTWELMVPALGDEMTTRFHRKLYLAGPSAISAALRDTPDATGIVMALGHNPGWEDAVSGLCNVRVRMLPGSAALLEVQAPTWAAALARTDWQLVEVVRPEAAHQSL